MADEHELRELHDGIEAGSDEMARYRAKLALRLEERGKVSRWRWLVPAIPIAAALIAWILYVPGSPDFEQKSLGELQTLVAKSSDPEAIERNARKVDDTRDQLTRYNANMLICLTEPDGGALHEAAHGAATDPRAEFRAWYLEYLLDHADSYQLDPEGIERRMDQETDTSCLKLYSRLLEMAERGDEITA